MLTKEIKRMERDHPGKVITGYGTCKFCGQRAACKMLEDWTEEEENEAATENCKCPEAKWYTAKKEQKERARQVSLRHAKRGNDTARDHKQYEQRY